jgi:hypothetical protein
VVTAYALAFGSLALVGGRLAHQHQSRHESGRAHVRSGTTRAYLASDDADFVTGTAFPLHGGTTAAFTVPDRPKRMVETRPLVTTKSNRYVTFSARAINHPAGPGRLR